MIKTTNIITFKNLSKYPNLIHAISTRSQGSMKNNNIINYTNINKFLTTLKINYKKLFLSEQTHSANVAAIDPHTKNNFIKNVDSLITSTPDIFLGIFTADCLPILLFDHKKSTVCIIHGGYRGINSHIIKNTIQKFLKLGSNIRDILVGIGPGIGVCCYQVSQERIEIFKKTFPSFDNFFQTKNNKTYLDLKKIAFQNLINEGIKSKNIEISNQCTAHNTDKFYSYRKEGQNAGRFISIIGMSSLYK
jgi:purine-nucleoside/S-methyl-5'-thioadenosine phosphorylase / adenosine deaminase